MRWSPVDDRPSNMTVADKYDADGTGLRENSRDTLAFIRGTTPIELRRFTNYDGSISSSPQQLVRPKSVEELQNILKQRDKYPSPVRAMGSYHSLTPCVSSPGTIVDMKALDKIVTIDAQKMTFTAQAGLEMIEAADACAS